MGKALGSAAGSVLGLELGASVGAKVGEELGVAVSANGLELGIALDSPPWNGLVEMEYGAPVDVGLLVTVEYDGS